MTPPAAERAVDSGAAAGSRGQPLGLPTLALDKPSACPRLLGQRLRRCPHCPQPRRQRPTSLFQSEKTGWGGDRAGMEGAPTVRLPCLGQRLRRCPHGPHPRHDTPGKDRQGTRLPGEKSVIHVPGSKCHPCAGWTEGRGEGRCLAIRRHCAGSAEGRAPCGHEGL